MCTFCKSRQEFSNPNSNEYLLTCKNWLRYSRERASHFFRRNFDRVCHIAGVEDSYRKSLYFPLLSGNVKETFRGLAKTGLKKGYM